MGRGGEALAGLDSSPAFEALPLALCLGKWEAVAKTVAPCTLGSLARTLQSGDPWCLGNHVCPHGYVAIVPCSSSQPGLVA